VLVWVASYPRSGNTFTRVVLRNVFGVGNHVVLTPDGLVAGMPRVKLPEARPVKEAELPDLPLPEQLAWMREHDETFWVKTHLVRSANSPDPALYCVRDGRDSLVSHAHYTGAHDAPRYRGTSFDERLEMLLHPKPQPAMGTWGSNVRRWLDRDAPTSIVRFEDLISEPVKVVRRACRKIGLELPPETGTIHGFAALQGSDPVTFRRGQTASHRDELPPPIERRFMRAFGEEMRALGYAP
jgi:hypothetical protein